MCTVLYFIGQQHCKFRSDLRLRALIGRERAEMITRPGQLLADVPLHVHCTYGRSEVLGAFRVRCLGAATAHREGLMHVKDDQVDLLFVTLEKSKRDYSPTTRYRDYALSRDLFHRKSQSGTTHLSPTGRRLLEATSTVLLFVHRTNKETMGRTLGFVFLGPVTLVDDRGEKPLAITWKPEDTDARDLAPHRQSGRGAAGIDRDP